MEEELNYWIVSSDTYRDIYDKWIKFHCDNVRSVDNEELMWKTYHIYTDSNDIDYDSTFRFKFKIRNAKAFSLARIKYEF